MKTKMMMVLAVLTLTACNSKKKDTPKEVKTEVKQEQTQELKAPKFSKDKGVAYLSGKITNKKGDQLYIINLETNDKKEIKLDENGAFKDSLTISEGIFAVSHGQEYTPLFLEVGSNLNLTLDTKQFDETVKYSGKGAEENNFLAVNMLKREAFQTEKLHLSKEDFEKELNVYTKNFNADLNAIKDVNKSFVAYQKLEIEQVKEMLRQLHENELYIKEHLFKGIVAPEFKEYVDYNGGTKSLSDFKGKFVYIDVWATWCGPCKEQMPYYKKVIEKYKGNDKIAFLSISTDEESNFDGWKAMVKEKAVGGVQLFSKRDINFAKNYRITSIPRFILIDPQGKIVKAKAPRPSSPKLIELFTSLGI